MIHEDASIEQLATSWLEAERRLEAEAGSERHAATARDMAVRYDGAIRDASVEDLRLAWEAAQKTQAACLIGTAEWGEARRVSILLRDEYLARRGE